MVEQSDHCPHLGLKQNRAIRFASPTPEHRCYVTGDAQEIPVDQANYCLSQGHVNCPLYMGLSLPSTASQASLVTERLPQGGLRGWLMGLSPRDRAIYGVLLALLLVIISMYAVVGAQLIFHDLTPGNVSLIPSQQGPNGGAVGTPTPSATGTLTNTPSPATGATITDKPTETSLAESPPDRSQTSTAISLTPLPLPSASITSAPDTETTVLADATEVPTRETAETVSPPPPTTAIPTGAPASGSTATPPAPTNADTARQYLTLYFTDPQTGALFVPVSRQTTVPAYRAMTTAVQELIAGPTGNLERLIPANVQLIDLRRSGGTITVNFDRRPSWPNDDRGLLSVALTLTEFPGIAQVQLQVNGSNIGLDGSNAPIKRPVLNPDNPDSLPTDYDSGTRFLPLYFRYNGYWVRITRLIPRTTAIAEETVVELLEGPGRYGNQLNTPIPTDTQLRGIWIDPNDSRTVVVDLTQPFASAADRRAALDTLVLSLTELRRNGERIFDRVEVLIEGDRLANFWGSDYARQFERPVVNVE